MNVADAEFELESLTTTDWSPAVEAGTVNVTPAGILPDPSVVVGPLKITGEPAKVAENVEVAAKPLPETVTVSPTLPVFSLRVIDEDQLWLAYSQTRRLITKLEIRLLRFVVSSCFFIPIFLVD